MGPPNCEAHFRNALAKPRDKGSERGCRASRGKAIAAAATSHPITGLVQVEVGDEVRLSGARAGYFKATWTSWG